ncbi:MAG: GNAT family N-acetyltransferase [Candidatus Thorarchaeota archaeon]
MDSDRITHIEKLSSNAWQAEEQEELGGWLLRADSGVTRRANSVLPLLMPFPEKIETAIERCNKFYQERNLPTLFHLTEASQPHDLDDVLDELGFYVGLQVYLQVSSVNHVIQKTVNHEICIESTPSEVWMDAYAEGSNYSSESMRIRKDLMLRSPLKKAFGSVIVDNEIAGVGLCILEGEYAGLYNMTTCSKYRKRGVAKSIGRGLTEWAGTYGAKKMYLQVEIENEPAMGMYSSLGFETAYRYWYRRNY